jgi:hypothetical protein
MGLPSLLSVTVPLTVPVGGITPSSNTSNPIQGATVSADSGQGDTTDSSGNYTLSNVPIGTQTVTASATGFVTQQDTNVVVSDGQTTSDVDFVLDPEPGTGTIKGTVTDANTGAKLDGVLVTADTGESATTNRGGKYTIRNVPEGDRTVTASKVDYDTQEQPAPVTAGQTTPVNFVLVPL